MSKLPLWDTNIKHCGGSPSHTTATSHLNNTKFCNNQNHNQHTSMGKGDVGTLYILCFLSATWSDIKIWQGLRVIALGWDNRNNWRHLTDTDTLSFNSGLLLLLSHLEPVLSSDLVFRQKLIKLQRNILFELSFDSHSFSLLKSFSFFQKTNKLIRHL